MRLGIKAVLGGTLLIGVLAAVGVHATNYSVWINGRTGGGQLGNHNDFSYFGSSTVAAGVNKKSANWDGYNRVADQNHLIRDALDCYCTGPNWCYIAAHSAGNLQIGYALDFFGGSQRAKKNPTPNAQGQCSNSDGTTQTGWNIKWVNVAGGAGGGSELANAGEWALSEPLVSDLKTSTARALYNHNNTRGSIFYMFARCTPSCCRGRTTRWCRITRPAASRAAPARRTATRRTGSATTSRSAAAPTRAVAPSGPTTR
jgi:hypothetical protein